MKYKLEQLEIKITCDGIKPINKAKFSGEILTNQNYKIYILKVSDTYLYVGKTKQTIGTRLGQGFRSFMKDRAGKKEGHYAGYKWIKDYLNKDKTLQLFVFDLGVSYSQNNAEAIESEIVFKIRQEYKRWPEYQNEIHFFNDVENASDEAGKILAKTK